MGSYPEMNEALPTNLVIKTRTARILTPAIIFAALIVVGIVSVIAIALSSAVFSSNGVRTGGLSAAEGFLMIASICSTIYSLLHLAAMVENEPVGVVRPPVNTTHAMCYIFARIALLFWSVTLIATCVVLSNPSLCHVGSYACKLQIVNITLSALAMITLGIIMTALESCHQPFEVPEAIRCGMITCRVSTFADYLDTYERSISQTSLYQDENGEVSEKPQFIITQPPRIRRKPAPIQTNPIPGEWPGQERPLTPLLPSLPKRSRSLGWGEEWTYGARKAEQKEKGMTHSDSAISMSMSTFEGSSRSGRSSASSGYGRSSTFSGYKSNSDRESDSRRISSQASQRPRLQRSVTPTSSIKNQSRRSPLSTMRSVDFPEVTVRPTLQYTPPIIPPPHEWRLSRTASMSQLLPIADIQYLQRRASNMDPPIRLRGPGNVLPPIPGSPTRSSRMRRNTVGSARKLPQMYDAFHEKELEEHIRKIELSIDCSLTQRRIARAAFARAQLQRTSQPPLVPVRARRLENPDSSFPVVEMQRHSQLPARASQQDPRAVRRSHTMAGETRPESPRFEDAVEITFEKVQPLRRLSLGSLPLGFDLGSSWEI